MFLSTKFIIKGISEFPKVHNCSPFEKDAIEIMKSWFINYDNSQIDKPTIVVDNNERAVLLYCNDALWDIVQKWQDKKLDNMSLLDGIKIWKEIKLIMEKK